jgi:hypothetical protein
MIITPLQDLCPRGDGALMWENFVTSMSLRVNGGKQEAN